MNKTLFILLFISNFGLAQNLVPNPSFEDTINCPNGVNSISSVATWFNPTQASPDYYHFCGTSVNNGIPTNSWGYQYAQDGNAYVGIATYWNDSLLPEYREYLEVNLISPLIANKTYYWCMWVSLLDSIDYATNNIGISLSNNIVLALSSQTILSNIVYGNHTEIVIDNVNWTEINGKFTAFGGEEYLIIGNFFTDIQTSILQMQQNVTGGPGGYYYIDNVYLGDSPCMKTEIVIPNIFTPNRDGVNDFFELNFPFLKVEIFNRWGQKLFESTNNESFWDGRTTNGVDVSEGTYYYLITTKEETYKGFVQVIR